MSGIFKKIGLGLAFSPRVEALLAECSRLKNEWDAELVLIHVGPHGTHEEDKLEELLMKVNLTRKDVQVFWEEGKASRRILEVCKKENVDLLVAGALKKENLLQFYTGSIARKILRKARCSVMILVHPSAKPKPLRNIVVNADNSPYIKEAIAVGCEFGLRESSAWLHIVREVKLYGLTMAVADQESEKEHDDLRHKLVQDEIEKVEQLMAGIPHAGLRVNIKIVAGKSGFELSRFAIKKHADLLVVGAASRRFFLVDRLFTHDLEYIFADLPCNLLMVHPRKEAEHE